MRLDDRPYDDSAGDFQRLWRFLVQDHADRGGRFRWTVGRMTDWKYNLATPRKLSPLFLPETAHLWFDPTGDLVALAIDENVDHGLAVFTMHRHEHLFGTVIDWAAEHWASRARPLADEPRCGELIIDLAEDDLDEARMLTARDWTDLGVKGTTRRYDVATIAARAIELPDRFRLTTMARDPDFASKLRLHHDAWGHDAPVTALDLDLFRYSRTAPTYDARLDISILAPDGEHVAGCIVFPDYANGDGEIERVCTHSAYRRRGLAMAAILGAFRAADAVGLKTATLTGYGEDAVRLYGRFEAVDTWTWHGWRTVVRLPPATTT